MQWRRRPDKDVWHFCSNCTLWPTKGEFKSVIRKPRYGEGCNQCIAKEKRGECVTPITEGT